MPKYRATVQVSGLAGENARAVRATLDEQLRKGGLEHCRVIAVDIDAPGPPPERRAVMEYAADARRDRPIDVGALLLVGAVAWAIWFFWLMLSSSP